MRPASPACAPVCVEASDSAPSWPAQPPAQPTDREEGPLSSGVAARASPCPAQPPTATEPPIALASPLGGRHVPGAVQCVAF